MKPWLKTTLVAAGGGAITALITAVLDPEGFTLKYHLGEGRLTIMVFTGAVTAVIGLFLQPPTRNGSQIKRKEDRTTEGN